MDPSHAGGEARGTEIFCTLLKFILPRVLIAHGAGTSEILSKILGSHIPKPTVPPSSVMFTNAGEMTVFVIPSLAPPAWNTWHSNAASHLQDVARAVASELSTAHPAMLRL
jgi:hypothetical protein